LLPCLDLSFPSLPVPHLPVPYLQLPHRPVPHRCWFALHGHAFLLLNLLIIFDLHSLLRTLQRRIETLERRYSSLAHGSSSLLTQILAPDADRIEHTGLARDTVVVPFSAQSDAKQCRVHLKLQLVQLAHPVLFQRLPSSTVSSVFHSPSGIDSSTALHTAGSWSNAAFLPPTCSYKREQNIF
jgi:hypothetical protein